MKKVINSINKGQGLYLPFILIVLALLLLYLINAHPKEKVVEKIKIEYIVKHDTVTIEKPIPIVEYKYKTIRDTVFVESKPVEIEIPITQKVYADSNYTAFVSGYRQNLDSIKLYRKDSVIIKTIERTITRNDYSRNGIGLNIGVSATMDNNKIKLYPAISVGYNLNLIRWRKRN